MSIEPAVSHDDTIVCAQTPWYYRRMGLMAAMFLGMGLYFCYDGKFGYPKENVIAEKKVWFEKEVMADYDVAKSKGDAELEAWMQRARTNGLINKPELNQPRWDDFAAPFGWPSEPKMHSPSEIEQQYYWGGLMLLGAVVCGLLVLINHNRTFVGKADQMIMPNGKMVHYADVFRVDKRKWDQKGLAHVYYRTGGAEYHTIIDDLKFEGAGRVLERLLALFSGELIEKVADDEPATETKVETSSQGEG